MKISLNWLKDYVEFDKKLSIEDIRWRLTEATAEIEAAVRMDEQLDRVVVGKIKTVESHPDADKLRVCQVDVGTETLQIVCGGANLSEDMNVVVSLPGAMVKWHGEGELVEVKEVKLRGVKSIGMICAAEEVGLKGLFPNEGEKDITDLSHLKIKPGTPVAQALELDDVVFEIDNHSITHRSDLFSHYGFARECVALGLGKWKKQLTNKDEKKLTGSKKNPLTVKISDKTLSKNYFGTVVSNVSTKQSPSWMKSRLNAVGIRSINAIVDITNYIMMDVGQPNHAFDLRSLEGKTFINRYSKKGEKVTTLDGIERTLQEGIIVGETEEGIIDLAGVMGGQHSEVKDDTTSVYFHSAQFNNVAIRKAIISLGHRTDGATMHEKDIEAERSQQGFIRGLELFSEIFPEAKFEHEVIHIQHNHSAQTKVLLPVRKIKSHLGLDINPTKAQQYLNDLGFKTRLKKDAFEVEVPTWRVNGVCLPEDVIEEIIRIHGYSHVPAEPPPVVLDTPVKDHKRHMRRTLQAFLMGQGYQEEVNFSFLSGELMQNMGMQIDQQIIEIANPVSEDFRYMRPNFLPYLLLNLSRNQTQQTKIWKSFEMGAVYKKVQKDVHEDHLLTLLVASPEKGTAFHNVLGEAKQMFDELGLEHQQETSENTFAYPNRCVEIQSEQNTLGFVYEVHPMLKENFRLKGSVIAVEINLDNLYRLHSKETHYQQINRNPEALLDINVVVDEETMVSQIQDVITSVKPEFLNKMNLVDVFQGESLGKGKKSFTFALSYQHPERTLEDQEIQNILQLLIDNLEKSGGIVRR